MKITWFGTATVALDDGETRLLFDPFVRMNKRLKNNTPVEGFTGFGDIFITHGHFDHLSSVPEIMKIDKSVKVHCTKTPAETLMKSGVPESRIDIIKPGDTTEIGDFKVTAFQGSHLKFDSGYILSVFGRCALRLPTLLKFCYYQKIMPDNGEIMIYLIENKDKKILLTGTFGTVDGVEYPKDVDLLVLANGGNSKIPEITMPFIESTRPKAVLADHFDDAFPPMTKRGNVEEFKSIMNRVHPEIEFIIPTEREPVEF